LEQHDDTRQQLHLLTEQMRQKSTQQSVNNETLAMRISDCMQRLLAAEEAKANVENKNALLQHALAQAKQEMLEKEEEAAEVLQSLKAINQQLIQALEDERKDAERRLADALTDAQSARAESVTAFQMREAALKKAEEAVLSSHAVEMETDKGLSLLHDELKDLREQNRELALKESFAAEERERVLRESASLLASRLEALTARDELSARCQEKECEVIEMRGKISLLEHKLGQLQQHADASHEARTHFHSLLEELQEAKGEHEEWRQKLDAATQLAEEFMEQAESSEHERSSLLSQLQQEKELTRQVQEAMSRLQRHVQILRDKEAEQEEESRKASTLALQQAEGKALQDKAYKELLAQSEDLKKQLEDTNAALAEKEWQMEEAVAAFQHLEVRVTQDKQETADKAAHFSSLLACAEEKVRALELSQRRLDIELQQARKEAEDCHCWRDQAEALREEVSEAQLALLQAESSLRRSEERKSSVIHMVNGLLSPSSTALATPFLPPASFNTVRDTNHYNTVRDTNHSAPHSRFLRSSASGAAGGGAGRGGGGWGGAEGGLFGEGGGRELRHVDLTPRDDRGPRGGVSGTDAAAANAAGSGDRVREQQANVQREVVEEL
jgi:epidermal growth factor receptor substrate 15